MILYAMEMVRQWAGRLLKSERGQDLTEYALLTGLIAIGLITAVGLFSGAIDTWFGAVTTWFGTLAPVV